MIKLLEQALATTQKLRDHEQDVSATLILEAFEDEALLKAMQASDRDEHLSRELALAILGQM